MSKSLIYGVPTDRCGLQLRLGIEKGFFRDEGIELDLRVVLGGPEIAAELDAGRLLIGELGTPPGLTAMANGAKDKLTQGIVEVPADFHQGDLYLCEESLEDLEGCLGAVYDGVDSVFGGGPVKKAFVCIRPPGTCTATDL